MQNPKELLTETARKFIANNTRKIDQVKRSVEVMKRAEAEAKARKE